MTTDYSTLDDQELEMLVADTVGEQITPLTDANDFEKIKQEIEKRGWRWVSGYNNQGEIGPYRFNVFLDVPSLRPWCFGFAKTEQRAGCEAFLLAVDAAKTKKDEQ